MEKGHHGESPQPRTGSRAWLGILLLVSGACSLIDQTVWLRQFRLLFGASTLATGAVLAVFMGGLGLGALVLGRRYDRHPHALRIYGLLEIGIGLSTLATPFMLAAAQTAYRATGGIEGQGRITATILQFVLTTLILGIPTFLMGGTLPLAARAMVGEADRKRRGVAILYGLNTVGAVAGVLLAGFLMLEMFGNRVTLWMSALVSLMVGLSALILARNQTAEVTSEIESYEEPSTRLILFRGAAAVSGFALLLMELVWYRMLTPLLGGTTYTFTVILAVVLLGIGCGSFLQASRSRSPSVSTFVWITTVESLALVIPFALGDRIALLALRLQPFAAESFLNSVSSWALVAAVVVFPAAFFSGMQFPTLVSLSGRGRTGVSREVGSLYGWNTVGAVAGALGGGFGILALLSAPNSWRLSVALLLTLAALVLVLERKSLPRPFAVSSVLVMTGALLFAPGPTAFWRQTPIGAGRANYTSLRGNELKNFVNHRRRITLWQRDGVESAVGVTDHDGIAFLINGKNDGHARFDAGTQVMGGLIGAMIHPNPIKAFVLGLGTGSTAGWLAAVPSIREVLVAELEPATARVAAECNAVNRGVSSNPKVRVVWGDGREILTTSSERFDIIFSEPSNPFRAGISSLFTAEFYDSVRNRLSDGGIFLQWVQAYEIDAETLQIIYATLISVFPTVETWQTERGDLVLAASMERRQYDWEQLQRRAGSEPFRSGLAHAWAARGAEGFLSHYIAGPSAGEAIAAEARRNTDDRTLIEFSFARAVGDFELFDPMYVFRFAKEMDDDKPSLEKSRRDAIASARLAMWSAWGVPAPPYGIESDDLQQRARIHQHFLQGARMVFDSDSRPDLNGQPVDELIVAQMLAQSGAQKYEPLIEQYRSSHPIEGGLVRSRFELQNGRIAGAASALAAAFRAYRTDPWPLPQAMERAFSLAFEIAGRGEPADVALMEDSLAVPFAVRLFNEQRMAARLSMAVKLDGEQCGARTMAAIAEFEPHIPWQRPLLELRARCLGGKPEGGRAEGDLRAFEDMAK